LSMSGLEEILSTELEKSQSVYHSMHRLAEGKNVIGKMSGC